MLQRVNLAHLRVEQFLEGFAQLGTALPLEERLADPS